MLKNPVHSLVFQTVPANKTGVVKLKIFIAETNQY